MRPTTDPHHVVGSLGSDFWRLYVPPQLVPELARKIDWNQIGRRVMIDAIEGVIVMMSPSRSHEDLAVASDDVVSASASVLNLAINKKRGTRWKAPDDPHNSGLEADAAFYIGKNAVDYYTAFNNGGEDAADRFADKVPPDLVVEVEVTHFDQDKPAQYARLGVREMWRVEAKKGHKQHHIDILALQKFTAPKVVKTSAVLNGLPSAILPQAFWLARAGRTVDLNALLVEHLVKGNDDARTKI